MRRNILLRGIALMLIGLFVAPFPAFAESSVPSIEKSLNIATFDSRPLSLDRLLYVALKDMGYHISLTNTDVQTGFAMADSGDIDGVISYFPNLEKEYPNLIKVPVEIERTGIFAFIRGGSGIDINSWDDLSGLRVGVLPKRPYINSKIPKDAELISEETGGSLLDGLAGNETDVVVLMNRANETLNLPDGVTIAAQLDDQAEYIYLNTRYGYLVEPLTESLNDLFAEGLGQDILKDIPTAAISQKKTVLHIISSNTETSREEQFGETIKKRFEDDMSVEWYTVILQSRRFSRDPNRLANIANLMRQDCMSKNISAIVVSGDDAMEFLADYYYLYFRNVPVLFYGVCDRYESQIHDYSQYFTGIVENLEAYETVSAALELFPDTKNLYVVNDYTTEGSHYRVMIEEQLKTLDINIKYNENIECASLLAEISELPRDSMVLVGSYFCDVNGQYYPSSEMKRLLEKNCSVPIFSMYSTKVEYNSIGGKSMDYEKYGEVIGGMLENLLNGANVTDIPVISDSSGYNRWVFNKTQMDIFGIYENALPAGAQVINKIPSIWESDPKFVIVVTLWLVISVAVVIGISIFVARRRKEKERVINDAKVREVKERLERIINTAPILFLITIDDIVVEMNENMKAETGIRAGDEVIKIYADKPERKVLIDRLVQEGRVINEVIKLNFADGKIHRCLLNIAAADYNGKRAIVVWAVDIEKSEIQRDQLQMVRQSLMTIMDTMPVSVRITDRENASVLYANNACLKMFGFKSFSDISGRLLTDLVPEFQSDGTRSGEKIGYLLRSSETNTMELEYLTAEGEIIDARITTCDIDYYGKAATIAILDDLTAEREYQRMLSNTAEKEREANLLKSRFLVNMSHEIRTPMNAIIGLTEIELHKNPHKETKEIYKKINTSARNLLEIVNDILDLSKIEADKIELYEDEFELEEVLNSALLVASPRLDGKNVEFMFNGSLDLPRFVVGDRTRLWQILKNFLDNSAKYTDNGKIVLTAFTNNKRSDSETVTITFVIEDTGIGIDEEQMKRIFMPYEQVYNDAQRKYTGTGLGMAISKQLCELMGGELQVESRAGAGTAIYLNIPFKRSKNKDTELQVVKSSALAGIKVLAVDDDKLSLDIMAGLLESSDVDCITAQSGMEAMEIVFEHRDKGEAFDLILLDYMMEGLNGLETARQIHLALSKSPKLLMVTAYQKLLLKSELEKNGIEDVIEKPFIPSHFIHKLCAVLGHESDDAEESGEVYTRFKDVNVLLCEDYRLNQEVAVGMFAQFGISSTIAENGRQAIEILNGGDTFDLIFMDLQMPVMDGYEATRIIRANPAFDKIPIISLTADAMKEIVDKCLQIGMNDHIAKPVEFDSLHRVFRKWLPKSKRVSDDKKTKPVVDPLNEGLARFSGNVERYEKALLEFAQLLPEKWDDFTEAVKNKEETGRYIHKLKGAAGNLAEKDIYKCAVDFESSLRGLEPDEALYKQLVSVCSTVRSRIIEKANASGGRIPEKGTAGEFMELINGLRETLQEYDPKASSAIIKSLEEKEWPSADRTRLRKLFEFTKKYEFDAALEILDEVMEAEK